jgi:hypothetical protein
VLELDLLQVLARGVHLQGFAEGENALLDADAGAYRDPSASSAKVGSGADSSLIMTKSDRTIP